MSLQNSCLANTLRSLKGGVCVAFSGGVDSSFLSWAAHQVCRDRVVSVLVVSELIPERDLTWARDVGKALRFNLLEVQWSPLSYGPIRENSPERCYWCKRTIYQTLQEISSDLGVSYLLDGTNADDLDAHRPGLKAVRELNVQTPLAECGFTKNWIRQLSQQQGIPSWDRPSQSCLATRIATGMEITLERLYWIDQAENYLKDLGLKGRVRVKLTEQGGLIQAPESCRTLLKQRWQDIKQKFRYIGFSDVELEDGQASLQTKE